MYKFRLYFDKDAETKWLNEMSAKGWSMEHFFTGLYHFKPCDPGKYTYQIDLVNRPFSVSSDSREFMEDTGAEILQSWGFWVILRRLSSQGSFELYTDVDSSIQHYTKILRMFKCVSILELLVLFFEFWAGLQGVTVGYVCSLLIFAMFLGILSIINQTKKVLYHLREQKGEAVPESGQRTVSMLLPSGLLLNCAALFLQGHIPDLLHHAVQIAALAMILVGIYQTAKKRRFH